jgi:hypothetical protein
MLANVKPFIGTWTIHSVTGKDPYLKENWQLLIGTNTQGDALPALDENYDVYVGFTVLDEKGCVILSSAQSNEPPLPLLFVDGMLRGAGPRGGRPFRVYISMAEVHTTLGTTFPALYGSSLAGDPDQVGVWGANGNPPPPPFAGGAC